MADTLDMTLDDIIKSNKKSSSSSGGGRREGRRGSAAGGSGGGVGPARRAFKRSGNRVAPYQAAKAPDTVWKHDMYTEFPAAPAAAGRVSAIETGTKLYISNLDYGVSNEDIKELFAELGDLKRSSIHYDRSGRSKGSAEVVFARRADALAAVKKYNNVQLDGKPMKIEIVGTNTPTAAAALLVANVGQARNPPKSTQGRVGPAGLTWRLRRPRGARGAGGRGKGQGRSKPQSAAELDADLEKYHADAMQTN